MRTLTIAFVASLLLLRLQFSIYSPPVPAMLQIQQEVSEGFTDLELEREARALLREYPSASRERQQKIIRRWKDIGLEARDATTVLVDALSDDESAIVTLARSALAGMAVEIASVVRELATHENAEFRQHAVWIVTHSRQNRQLFASEFAQLLADTNKQVRKTAISRTRLYQPLPPEIVDGLIQRLGDSDPFMITYACDALRRQNLDKAFDPLANLVETHDDAYVRSRAMGAICQIDIDGQRAIPVVAGRLHDDGQYGEWNAIAVRSIALRKLASFNGISPDSAQGLFQLFEKREFHNSIFEYDLAVHALSGSGVKDLQQLLEDDLENESPYEGIMSFTTAPDFPPAYFHICIRACAARAILRIDPQNRQAVDLLLQILEDNTWDSMTYTGAKGSRFPDPRSIAVSGLATVENFSMEAEPVVRSTLRKALDSTPLLTKRAAWALACIADDDEECLLAMREYSLAGNQDDMGSTFYRVPARKAAAVLGKRIQLILPGIMDALAEGDSDGYFLRMLQHADPEYSQIYVEHLLDAWEHEDWQWNIEPFLGGRVSSNQLAVRLLDALRLFDDSEFVVARLNSIIANGDMEPKIAAIQFLGLMGNSQHTSPASVSSLVEQLRAPRPLIRGLAAQSLAQFQQQAGQIIPGLESALDDRYEFVVNSARESIAKLKKSAK